MPARDLLAEALSEGEGAPQDAQADGGKALVVNARYAAGYEERKRKKELARLSARAAERDDDSSSDSEEEDEGEVDPETEAQFTRDPRYMLRGVPYVGPLACVYRHFSYRYTVISNTSILVCNFL